jgi:hypothetical protein
MMLSSSEVLPIAESTGFNPGIIEKVLHLLNILDALTYHPYPKGKWVLKDGTALNLFRFRKVSGTHGQVTSSGFIRQPVLL